MIERFSEDIDLSIHWAELAGHSEEKEQETWKASTRSRSQNQRFREHQQTRLEEWTAELVEKLNQRFQSYGISGLEARLEVESRGEKVDFFLVFTLMLRLTSEIISYWGSVVVIGENRWIQ
ncbi:TPA: nucleotidyl transferase AbiEii/AbiGii toxin family protein [Klebsiella pneumoniae]|uniref:nucleotidyl transferase AbiEii/AbiGii toxin family protein n=1 Tax=Klebsiella TaxID=570 RepID=UPI00222875B5|nr:MULTISPECIES: nucleotidyl transferase AbiEii/AbiGii toxin family protein [Klebsiella]MEE1965406.1 nucleotidyl transferase AbiEii/AbiGii toxin family protein [Klebsiella michiganensis]